MKHKFTFSSMMKDRCSIGPGKFLKLGNVRIFLFVFLLLGISHFSIAQKWILEVEIRNNGCGSYDGTPFVENSGNFLYMTAPDSNTPPSTYPYEIYTGLFIVNGSLDPVLKVSVIGYSFLPFTFDMNADASGGYITEQIIGPSACNVTLNASISKVPDMLDVESSYCGDGFIPFGNQGVTWIIADNVDFVGSKSIGNSSGGISMANFPLLAGKKYGKRFVMLTYYFPGFTEWPVFSFDYFPAAPQLIIVNQVDPVCFGASDGSIKVDISNADPAIPSFDVTVRDATNAIVAQGTSLLKTAFPTSITGLPDGRYTVEIKNSPIPYTCSNKYGSDITLVEPSKVSISNFIIEDTKCKDNGLGGNINSGSITATASGGSGAGYTYFQDGNPLSTNVASGLTKGDYTITATDSKGCPSPDSVKSVSEPLTAIDVSLSSTAAYFGYDISCNGASDGSILASPSLLAATDYTFEWYSQPSNTLISGQSGQTLLSGGKGGYAVKLIDGNGCVAQSSTINLEEPPTLDFTIDPSGTLTCAGDKIGLTANGTATYLSTVNGQRLPLTYVWDPDGETGASVTGKPAGDYGVTVSDKQGCNLYKTHTIVDPPGSTVSLSPKSYNGSQISCQGASDGILSASVTGAVEGYTWYKNNNLYNSGTSLAAINNLDVGFYKVVITYNTQCQAESLPYSLIEPDPILVSASATTNYNGQPISCHDLTDANIKATALGGTGAFNYLWNSTISGSLLTGVGAGSYTVDVTDVNGCVGTKTVVLDNPDAVQASILNASDYSGFGISCFGKNDGAIAAAGSGGTGTYSYVWSNSNNTATINGLMAGDYLVTVSDNNGCTSSISKTLTEPDVLELQVESKQDLSCFQNSSGIITLKATGGIDSVGGVNAYEYSKNNGVNWSTNPTFDLLAAGTHNLILRDGNGCLSTTSTLLSEPTLLDIAFTDNQPAFCDDPKGAVTSVVTGGVGNYIYEWRNTQNQVLGTGITLSNVKGGIYRLYIEDGNKCLTNKSTAITSTDGATATWDALATTCFDTSDGEATITITQGQGPFEVAWPDGQTSLQVQNVKGGLYYVEITDVNNCMVVEEVMVPSPAPIELTTANVISPTCAGFCDGQMTLVASGGAGNYAYQWNGNTNAQQTQLCAGTYAVVVNDSNGCTLNQDEILTQPDPLALKTKSMTLPTCYDQCDGALEIEAFGGNGGYQYLWDIGGDESAKSNLCPRVYTISTTDSKGCQEQSDVVLENPPPIIVDLGGSVILCVGQSYYLDAGSGWTDIKWTSNTGFSSTEQKVTIKEPGQYNVEVTNPIGCIGNGMFLMETSTDLMQASFIIPSEAVIGDTVAIIDISWPLPETIEWDFPASMNKVIDLGDVMFGQFNEAGTYTVGLTAHLGECLGQVSKIITILTEKEGDSGGRFGYEEFVTEFVLHPNPNNGSFEVGVELIEKSPISLSVWSNTNGVLINQVSGKDEKSYKLYFDLRPLSSGIYVIRLDHAKGKAYLRFIVY